MSAVRLREVTKTFGDGFVAVNNLSLDVNEGTIHGFIGPNGSGKTTTLRMIMRIFHPDRGTVEVLGEQGYSSANDRVGYLPEERGLYKQMKVRELLRYFAQLKGANPTRAELDDHLERMGLGAWGDKKIAALSKGMAQKVQFLATIISRPSLVLLDEPFSGLDPVNGEVLRQAVLDLKRNGSTVIFSTHDMGVAERMCDVIFMIYKGNTIFNGTLDDIQAEYGEDTVRVRMGSDGAGLAGLPGVEDVTDFGRYHELRLHREAEPQRVLAELMRRGDVRHFEVTRPSLRDIFVRVAGEDLPDDTNGSQAGDEGGVR
jgi:ABC-2 type transport system ATP-binding protein